jgi:hypothetical protein
VVATVAACEKLAAGGEKKLVKVKWFNSNKEFGIITPGDGGDEESASNSDSDVPKKKRPAAKPAARLPSAKKGKGVAPAAKEKADVKGKGKKKADDESGSGAENGADDDDSELSEDPLEEVNPDNILSSRTRRRTAQPVSYDFGSGDLDEDEDSDEE